MITNEKFALMLEEVAQLLELEGEKSAFRIGAYNKAATSIRYHPQAVVEMEDVTVIKGVGASIAAKIDEIKRTGTLKYLEELRSRWPASVLELTMIRGIGPKKAFKIYQDHGINNFEELVDAVLSRGLLVEFKDRVEFALKDSKSGYSLQDVVPVVSLVSNYMQDLPQVVYLEVVGSYRRKKSEIHDLDIIVCAEEKVEEIHSHFLKLGKVLVSGSQKSRIMFDDGTVAIQLDLLVVPLSEWGSSLCYFTGSKVYNPILRGYAKKLGYLLNEHGLWDSKGSKVAGESEESIYTALGLPWCPPEFREEENGLLTEIPTDIVGLEDITQDIHCHTNYSDGSDSVKDMVLSAKDHGVYTIGIADHIANSNYGYKLRDYSVHRKRMEEVLSVDVKYVKVLAGAEVDVDIEGSLECPPEVLVDLDYVIIALHDSYDKNILERLTKAIQNKKVVALAHPTGRLKGVRPHANVDWDSIFKLLSDNDVALEINCLSDRLDLSEELVRRAIKQGCKFIISSDSHNTSGFSSIFYGVHIARRAMMKKTSLLRMNYWRK